MNIVRINQSLIHDIGNESSCPKRYYEYHVTKSLKRKRSDAMLYGQYFEWMALGSTTREGEIPVIPQAKRKTKNGDLTPIAQVRINEQAEIFKQYIIDNKIKIVHKDYKAEMEYELEDGTIAVLHCIFDVVAEMEDGSMYIIDTKLTGSVDNDFGPYPWGNFYNKTTNEDGTVTEDFDKLQAHMYKIIAQNHFGMEFNFAYFVFDYKPKYDKKWLPVDSNEDDYNTVINRIEKTYSRLNFFKENDYEPIPNIDECKRCEVDCIFRMKKEDLFIDENIYDENKLD